MDSQDMWEIRSEAPEDFAAIRDVHERAFAPSLLGVDGVPAPAYREGARGTVVYPDAFAKASGTHSTHPG